jgi:hypothetical protein
MVAALGRFSRITALCVVAVLLPSLGLAQDNPLRLPTFAATAAAAADWGSTYYAVKYFRVREVNPLINQLEHDPARMVSIGAAMDTGLVAAWNLSVGRKNERLAATGLWAMAAFRTFLTIHNLRNTRKAARREIVPAPPTLAGPAIRDVSWNCEGLVTVPACAAAARSAR